MSERDVAVVELRVVLVGHSSACLTGKCGRIITGVVGQVLAEDVTGLKLETPESVFARPP